jgi:hypothetical protein
MARRLRIQCSGGVWHIICQGNEKRPVFKGDDDRETFLNRPELGKIFPKDVTRDRTRRDEEVGEAAENYGYTQREVSVIFVHKSSLFIFNEHTIIVNISWSFGTA